MKNKLSVIIIHYNREKHLENLLKGITQGTCIPEEIVIVDITESRRYIQINSLVITYVHLDTFDTQQLPIARARNLGAQNASYENLVFLDVDCIPCEHFIQHIKETLPLQRALYMGYPKYLKKNCEVIEKSLQEHSISHPLRPKVSTIEKCKDYGMFWSLCFFITTSLFFELGGFDEAYQGYGAEDTDFAFTARQWNIPFYLTPFIVYHQQHSFFRPPFNHLYAIVANSNHFNSKWKCWPMTNHLQEFNRRNFIEWKESNTDTIKIKKTPSRELIADCFVEDQPFA
ncbi:glycosyltransferase [Aquimarina sp. U1-2]|uniref:glycosyltransferase family 2 protein n=1 Tax=Aquimarina sp. U1-2 TaxID=2823141 RepID=UPI001AECF6DA|nr:glycosyltransferase [Aquimarina sp. U1-2]MBP2832925.1 glycosyltransferase [Aquimarina sp. U1-2]